MSLETMSVIPFGKIASSIADWKAEPGAQDDCKVFENPLVVSLSNH